MILPDVNVLVHAFRADSSDHENCRKFLLDLLGGDASFGMNPQVLASFIRIVTNAKVFTQPSLLSESFQFCESILTQLNCVIIRPADRHWEIFSRLCIEADARANLVPDAWFAALAIESGCQWVTLDRDFARFPGLEWQLLK